MRSPRIMVTLIHTYSFKVALGQTRGKSIPASLPLALAPPTINNSPLPDYLVPPAPVGLLAALACSGWPKLLAVSGTRQAPQKRVKRKGIHGERNLNFLSSRYGNMHACFFGCENNTRLSPHVRLYAAGGRTARSWQVAPRNGFYLGAAADSCNGPKLGTGTARRTLLLT